MRLSTPLFLIPLIGAVGLSMLAPAPAAADFCDSTLVLGTTYVVGPAVGDYPPIVPGGETLSLYGVVSALGGPLTGAAGAGSEVTWVIRDITCFTEGMWDDPETNTGGTVSLFYDCRMDVYVDDGTTAEIDNPETYADGTLALTLDIPQLDLLAGSGGYPPTPEFSFGALQVTGGAWYDLVSKDGNGFAGDLRGRYPNTGSGYNSLPPGVLGVFLGRVTLDCSVPVRPITWGRIKTRYE